MSRTFISKLFPGLSNQAPWSEGVTPSAGSEELASRGNHVHQRLTSATAGTTNAQGEATVTFTRTFANYPCVDPIAIESADNGMIGWKVKSWVIVGGVYTGAVIKAYRIQPLPSVLTLLTQLLSFRVDAGNAANIPFTCIALERSD